MSSVLTQFYPPAPTFTEKECPDLSSKIFIVTGGYSGVGCELVKILYQKNASIYIAGRSKSKADEAITNIKTSFKNSTGQLEFLSLDLGDLTTIQKSVQEFRSKEKRLDVLWNNAGVMTPPAGSKTTQGYELQLGTNCLGHFLFTKLLLPLLQETAQTSPPNSVRVLFTGSLVAQMATPKGGINFDDINYEKGGSPNTIYAQSKVGNIFLAAEFARLERESNGKIIFASLNPGNLKSPLQRHVGRISNAFFSFILHDPIYGAYTELFAGLSPTITQEHAGRYIIPWGRIAVLKTEILDGIKEGGTGAAKRFWQWCDTETRVHVQN